MKHEGFVIVADCDDVLVEIGSKVFEKALLDDKILNLIPDEALERAKRLHPVNRPGYLFATHFGLPEDSEEFKVIDKAILDKYFLDPEFYDDLPPTVYMQSLHMMAERRMVKHIHVATQCMDLALPVTRSKVRFLNRVFAEFRTLCDIDFMMLEHHESKSSAINKHHIQYDSFVDDSLKNIIDVIENTQSHSKEFLIPIYGHNTVVPNLQEYRREKGVRVVWFENGFVFNGNERERLVSQIKHPVYEGWSM